MIVYYDIVTEDLRQLGETLLGKTSGNMKKGKETWWWNEDVQESIQTKKLAKRTLDKDNNEENKAAYKTAKKEIKKKQAPMIACVETWIPPKDRGKYRGWRKKGKRTQKTFGSFHVRSTSVLQ